MMIPLLQPKAKSEAMALRQQMHLGRWPGRPLERLRRPLRTAPKSAQTAELSGVDIPGLGGKEEWDALIVGAGPAGLATAEAMCRNGMRACVVDPEPSAKWPNNYGVWVDELEAVGLEDCAEYAWPKASVEFPSGKRVLNRAYARVDRERLKSRLVQSIASRGGGVAKGKATDWSKRRNESMLTVRFEGDWCLKSSVVLDATGYPGKLVGEHHENHPGPGWQVAVGVTIETTNGPHPFPTDEMLFMDWRGDHLPGDKASSKEPTFLYAMPFDERTVFVEETSLVARPAISFETCRQRLYDRLQHLGITNYRMVEPEEELCLIPMGGPLPDGPSSPSFPVPIGATALFASSSPSIHFPIRAFHLAGAAGGVVHPATGYSIARSLTFAPRVAEQLARGPLEASVAWSALWPSPEARRRAFFVFGMEVLLNLDLEGLRSFFSAFFALEDRLWQGFLSGWLTIPELFELGAKLFASASPRTKADLALHGLPRVAFLSRSLLSASRHGAGESL